MGERPNFSCVAVVLITTGRKPYKHEILEVGGIHFEPFTGKVIGEFSRLIALEKSIPREITKKTGITFEDTLDASVGRWVIGAFLDWISSARVVVAHDARIQKEFLQAANGRFGLAGCHLSFIDTLPWCMATGIAFEDLELRTVSAHFGYENTHFDRAMDRAYATANLFVRLASVSEDLGDDLQKFAVQDVSIEPTSWRTDPATAAQLDFLAELGISTPGLGPLTKGEASDLISIAVDGPPSL